MDQAEARPAAPQYRAFISYSHADARFGGWLHRRLENARLPDGSRLAPIFIDRAELAAGSDLSAQVRDALSRSAALVVVASPAARASRWVGQEIELFRELHPERPILAALVASEPDEAFPPALLGQAGRTLEPLAADFREGQDGKRLGLLKIVAGLTGQPLDRLDRADLVVDLHHRDQPRIFSEDRIGIDRAVAADRQNLHRIAPGLRRIEHRRVFDCRYRRDPRAAADDR